MKKKIGQLSSQVINSQLSLAKTTLNWLFTVTFYCKKCYIGYLQPTVNCPKALKWLFTVKCQHKKRPIVNCQKVLNWLFRQLSKAKKKEKRKENKNPRYIAYLQSTVISQNNFKSAVYSQLSIATIVKLAIYNQRQ